MTLSNPFKSSIRGVRVVRTDAEIACPDIDEALRLAGAELVLLPGGVSEADLIAAVQEADLLLMCYTPITANVIEQTTKLRGIVKYGVGIDAIDIEAAMEKGIPTVNVPEYAENTVAEGAFCLLLGLAKRLLPVHKAVQSDGWIHPDVSWLGNDIRGMCVAIVGLGRIGSAFARMAGAGFGARVIGFDPAVSAEAMNAMGVEKYHRLPSLLAEADVVSLHCVLNSQTRTLIGHAEFSAMRRKPIFINVSRGALVDEQALIDALDSGQVRAAGLDVYGTEPLSRHRHPLASLFDRDNVILFPHLTFYTVEAMQRLSEEVLRRSAELLAGEPTTICSTDPRLTAQFGRLKVRRAEPAPQRNIK